ncbi:hypothetical protein EMCG_03487 [[Emmonsia] crescens]|uniref:Uncharacterized protein n=1 Tax=[Emmonsia] crescens TaxID=73230 RepID=A0A0G2HW86_9EURO|nr:hypothetical protein EMCG_03487 [Emmonsia crescens UAMH 3008]
MASSPPALTTRFPPPASCLNDAYEVHSLQTVPGSERVLEKIYHELGPRSADCFPSGGYLPWEVDQVAKNAFYSPAVCPSGYLICSSDENSIGTLTETRATCCPNGFSCNNQSLFYFSDKMCTLASHGRTLTFTVTSNGTALTKTNSGAWALNAYGISIRWMSSDFAPATTTTSQEATETATTSREATETSTTSRETTPMPTASPSTTSPGLSAGAKAGIGIGVAAVALLLVVMGWLLYNALQKRKDKQEAVTEFPDYQAVRQKPASKIGTSGHKISELDSTRVHEMDAAR